MPLVPHVAAGQIVASNWGNLVADQVVMRFTTAAQRASQLTAPVLNQMTTLDNRLDCIQRWNGSAWVDMAPLVQTLNQTVTTDAAGHTGVTFPTAFGAAPTYFSLAPIGPASVPTPFGFLIETLAAGSVVFRVYNNNAPYNSSSITIVWIAVGPRPAAT